MPSFILDQYRRADPDGLGKLSDEALATAVYNASGSKMPFRDYMADIGLETPKSDAGAEFKSGMAGWAKGLAAIPTALGIGDGATYRRLGEREEFLGRMSSAPSEFKDVTVGENAGAYLRRLALGSAPYAAEFAVGALTGGLTSGAKMAGERAAIAAVEGGAETALKRSVVTEAEKRIGEGMARDVAYRTAAEDVTRNFAANRGGLIAAYPSAAGDVLNNQYEQNGKFDPLSAFALAVPYDALNLVGVEGMATRAMTRGLPRVGLDNFVARGAVGGGLAAGAEAVGEGGQQALTEMGRAVVDPNYRFDGTAQGRIRESMIGGAALGFMPGSVGGAFARGPQPVSDKQPEDLLQLGYTRQIGYSQQAQSEEQKALGYDPRLNAPVQPLGLPAPATTNAFVVDSNGNARQAYRSDILDPSRTLPAPSGNPDALVAGPAGVGSAMDYHNAALAQHLGQLPVSNEGGLTEITDPAVQARHAGYATTAPQNLLGAPDTTLYGDSSGRVGSVGGLAQAEQEAQLAAQQAAQQRADMGLNDRGVVAANEKAAADTAWRTKILLGYQKAKGRARIGDILSANSPEHAAEMIRARAVDGNTKFSVLDAMHKELTGQTIEEWDASPKVQFKAKRANDIYAQAFAMHRENKLTDDELAAAERGLRGNRYGAVQKALDEATVRASMPEVTPAAPVTKKADVAPAAPVVDEQTKPAAPTKLTKREREDVADLDYEFDISESTKDKEAYKAAIDEITHQRNENPSESVREHAQRLLDTFPKQDVTDSAARYETFKEVHKATESKKGTQKSKKNKDLLARGNRDETGMGHPKEKVLGWVNRIIEGWKNAPQIFVVQSIDDLPPHVADGIREQGMEDGPGFYDPDTKQIIIIADNAIDFHDVAMTVAHEATGHFGLRAILGDEYSQAMNRIFAGNATVRGRANEKISKGMNKELAVEEVLAEMQEDGVAPKEQGLFEKLYELIRNALKKIGVDFVSDNEVAALLQDARQYVIEGKEGSKTVNSLGQPVAKTRRGVENFARWFGKSVIVDGEGRPLVLYHGTTGDFDVFNTDGNKYLNGFKTAGAVWLTTRTDEASWAAENLPQMKGKTTEGANVMPVYASISKPFITKDWSAYPRWATMAALKLRGYDGVIHSPDGTIESASEILAFDSKQIKSSIGNNGGFDRQNPNILFRSRAATTVKSAATDAVREVVSNTVGKVRRAAKSMMMLNMFEEEYGDRLTAIKDYRDNSKAQGATQREWLEKAGGVENDRRKLDREQDRLLSQLQLEATRAEIHPDKPFADSMNAHLAGVDGARQAHAKLAAMWSRLSADAKAVYKAELEFNEKARNEQEAYTNRLLTDVYTKQIDQAKADGNEALAKRLEAERRQVIIERGEALSRIRGPYFALMRSGDFVVVGKSTKFLKAEERVDAADKAVREALKMEKPDAAKVEAGRKEAKAARVELDKLRSSDADYIVEFHGSEFRAKERREELSKSMANSYKMMRNEFSREYSGINASTMSTVKAAVAKDFDPKVASQLADLLERLMLEHLPDASIKKHDLTRVSVAGAEEDMGLAFRQNAFRTAFALSRLKNASAISDALFELRDQAQKTGRDADDEVYNVILNNHLASMQYKETPIQNAAVSASYLYHLAWSPAFLLQNMLQNPMLTVPMLAAKFGFTRSMATWASAAGEVTKFMQSNVDKGVVHFKLDIDNLTKDAGERKMLDYLLSRGLIDITIDNEMDLTGNPVAAKARNAMRWAAYPASWMEVVNRSSAAMAAYRLARKTGMKEQEAINYAERVVNDTHIDYSSENAPYWMRAGVVPMGKVFFQFRKFQIGMLYQMVKNFRDAVKGDKEAGKVLLHTLVMQQAIAGAAGFPLAAPIGFIANLIGNMFGDDDEPFDAEVWWRNFLEDMLGEAGGRAVAKGLPTLANLDVSGSVGLGNIMSIFPYTKEKSSYREQGLEYMAQFFGPAGGVASDFLEGLDQMQAGNVQKGVEKMLPRTLRNLVKAERLGAEGLTTKAGNEVMGADKFDALDVFNAAAGLPNAKVNDLYKAKQFVEDQKSARTDVRNGLIKDMLSAEKDNDRDAMTSVQQDIDQFNSRHPDDRITRSTIIKSRQARAQYQKELDSSGVRIGKRERELKDSLKFAGS